MRNASSQQGEQEVHNSFGEHIWKLQDMRMPQTADLQHLRRS